MAARLPAASLNGVEFYLTLVAAIRTKVRVPRGSASTVLDFTELFHKSG
jgi:hypothetical protein